MPHPATSLPVDAEHDAAEHAGFDVVYEVDVELLRGCRRPIARYAAGAGPADEDLRAAGPIGAR